MVSFDAIPVAVATIGVAVAAASAGLATFKTLRSARTDEVDARKQLADVRKQESALAAKVWLKWAGDRWVPADSEHSSQIPPEEEQRPAHRGDTTFEALWNFNQQRIDAYHTIATSQSKTSFISSKVATALGFALIIVVGLIAARAQTTVGAISAGAVGVVGGGLSAYISSTFMRAQVEASAQLREFFLQPVEFARVLAAERLLEGMDEAERSKTRSTMIAAMMSNTITRPSSSSRATTKPKKIVKKSTA